MSLSEEHRERNSKDIPTLVDCGCKAVVWNDESGVEIEYCPTHKAAPDLMTVLEDALAYFRKVHEHDCIGWECAECYPQLMASKVDNALGQVGE